MENFNRNSYAGYILADEIERNPLVDGQVARMVKWMAVGVLGLAGYLFVRKRLKSVSSSVVQSSAIKSIPITKSNLSISDSEAQIIAQGLYTAMEGSGTDENAIVRMFEGRTSDDIKLIVQKFGIRPYGTFGAPLFSWMETAQLDLMGWLKKELSGSKLKAVQQIFASAGIPF